MRVKRAFCLSFGGARTASSPMSLFLSRDISIAPNTGDSGKLPVPLSALRQFARFRIQSAANRSAGTRKMWVFIELANGVPSANTNQVTPCASTPTRPPLCTCPFLSANRGTRRKSPQRIDMTTHDRSKIPRLRQ